MLSVALPLSYFTSQMWMSSPSYHDWVSPKICHKSPWIPESVGCECSIGATKTKATVTTKEERNRCGGDQTVLWRPSSGLLPSLLFFLSCVRFLPCWSSSSLTSDQIWTRPGCKPYLLLFIVVGAIRYSLLCHSAFANAHSPALIYASLMTGGPRRTLHPPVFSYKALLQGPVWICFFWTVPAVSLPDPIFLFVCLYSFLSLYLLLLLPIHISPLYPNLLCLRVHEFFLSQNWVCSHFLCQILPSFRD